MSRAYLITRKRLITELGIKVGAARAAEVLAKADFDEATEPEDVRRTFVAYTRAGVERVEALEAFFRAQWAFERNDIEEQLRMTLEMRAAQVMGAQS